MDKWVLWVNGYNYGNKHVMKCAEQEDGEVITKRPSLTRGVVGLGRGAPLGFH